MLVAETGNFPLRAAPGEGHRENGPAKSGQIPAADMNAALMRFHDVGGDPKPQAGACGAFGGKEWVV